MHAARMHFLGQGSLFGLAYTPYCFYDLKMRASN